MKVKSELVLLSVLLKRKRLQKNPMVREPRCNQCPVPLQGEEVVMTGLNVTQRYRLLHLMSLAPSELLSVAIQEFWTHWRVRGRQDRPLPGHVPIKASGDKARLAGSC